MLYRQKQWNPEDEDICIFRDCNIHELKNILFDLNSRNCGICYLWALDQLRLSLVLNDC